MLKSLPHYRLLLLDINLSPRQTAVGTAAAALVSDEGQVHLGGQGAALLKRMRAAPDHAEAEYWRVSDRFGRNGDGTWSVAPPRRRSDCEGPRGPPVWLHQLSPFWKTGRQRVRVKLV